MSTLQMTNYFNNTQKNLPYDFPPKLTFCIFSFNNIEVLLCPDCLDDIEINAPHESSSENVKPSF